MPRRPEPPRRTARIYYGPPSNPLGLWWTVKVKDARSEVTINGTLEHALRGEPGSTIGCHLSNCARDNSRAFPHPYVLASFTRAKCLIVTKVANGAPIEAVEYRHDYGHLVDMNDRPNGRDFLREHPEMAERQFILKPPRERRPSIPNTSGNDGPHRERNGTRTHLVAKGALARAVTAGLISMPVAEALDPGMRRRRRR